jgi:HEAT repeat protein
MATMLDSRLTRVGRVALAGSLPLVWSCAPPPAPEPPAPVAFVRVAVPLTLPEIEAAALLLGLEDRREFADTVIADLALAPESPIRAKAALAAGRIGTQAGAQLVRYLLIDTDTAVAAAAAFMAGQLRDTASTSYLVTFLDAGFAVARPTVATEAAGALGKLGTPEARAALAAFLLSPEARDPRLSSVVQEALIASWRAGETGVQPYLPWLEHDDSGFRWRAAYALSRRARAEAAPPLFPLLEDPDPLTRSFVLRGLTAPLVASSGLPRAQVL